MRLAVKFRRANLPFEISGLRPEVLNPGAKRRQVDYAGRADCRDLRPRCAAIRLKEQTVRVPPTYCYGVFP